MKIRYIVAILSVIVMILLGAVCIGFSEKEESFSEKENRLLQGFPQVDLSNVFSGEFSQEFENFLIDKILYRNQLVAFKQFLEARLSIATIDDSMNIVDVNEVNQMEGDIVELEGGIANIDNTPSITPAPTPAATLTSDEPNPTPIADYGNTRYIYMIDSDENKTNFCKFSTDDIINFGKSITPVAQKLPENGHIVYITCALSSRMRKPIALVDDEKDITIVDETDEVLMSYTPDNTIVLSGYEILGEKISAQEYVYFYTDMHWSVEGSYYVYAEAFERMDKQPLSWDDYNVTYEAPFLGTYYRDDPKKRYKANPDTLAIIDFDEADYYTRYITMEETVQLPIINEAAKHNDRFTVYFGKTNNFNTMGQIETTSHTGENAIVIQDSYGLCFTNLLIPHYDNIYIFDMRYLNRDVITESLCELVDKYSITDLFIVTGEMNSYGSSYNNAISTIS